MPVLTTAPASRRYLYQQVLFLVRQPLDHLAFLSRLDFLELLEKPDDSL